MFSRGAGSLHFPKRFKFVSFSFSFSFSFCLHLLLIAAPISLSMLQRCWHCSVPDSPCDPPADTSACCGQGYLRSTNLYCTASAGVAVLVHGTDQTWQCPSCPFIELSECSITSPYCFHLSRSTVSPYIYRCWRQRYTLHKEHHLL